jgi:hypothetical protein
MHLLLLSTLSILLRFYTVNLISQMAPPSLLSKCKAFLGGLIALRPVDGADVVKMEVWGKGFCSKLVHSNMFCIQSFLLTFLIGTVSRDRAEREEGCAG